MIFERGVYRIEHDPERTREYYARASAPDCICAGCRNFRAAVSQMSPELRAFLEQFGIDPAKPAEASVLCAVTKDKLSYCGIYHFCGEIQEGLEPFIQIGEKSFQLDQRYQLSVNEGEQVWFGVECVFLETDALCPAVQAEVDFKLPWVLEEKNTY